MKIASRFFLLILLALSLPVEASHGATKHTITFGPGYYSPDTLTVFVGDTVVWQADDSSSFTLHPLESYDFPAGAASILVSAGLTYPYVVTAEGTYKYRCQFHWMNGMLGEFTAKVEDDDDDDDDDSTDRHVIMFGPGYYSPADLEVEVGDVIVWQADDSSSFALHPLESYDFPAGAASILVTSGTTYEYTVTVEGTYKYRCQLHWQNGMLGQFVAKHDDDDDDDDDDESDSSEQHVIMFGPGYYSPADLDVDVGDVVIWQADDSSSFALHPLESYDFPAGAAPILVDSGTRYEYLVTVPGTYKYRCQLHWQNGMLGQFTAEVDDDDDDDDGDDDDSTGHDISRTKYVITFGPGYYSPKKVHATIGDTIVWMADDSSSFATLPLESYLTPPGVPNFSASTGTSFEYVVTRPGHFKYRNPLDPSMRGQFTVSGPWTETMHVVMFGPSYFSPGNFIVDVGDTVLWMAEEGISFANYPLISTSVPNGAMPISVTGGSMFAYPITAAGTYTYTNSGNMSGSFTAVDVTPNKHVIMFADYFYDPAFISTVDLGDTIEWRGDFSRHPLISVSVPAGASNFSSNSGTVYQYVVTTHGTYAYACAAHGLSNGMAGAFSTQSSGVRTEESIAGLTVHQAYPNPSGGMMRIPFDLDQTSDVKVTLFDITGGQVSARPSQTFAQGSHEIELDLAPLPSGVYTFRLESRGRVITGQVLVAK